MTDDQFEALVARLEQEQARNPAAYRRKVLALAFAGYAYIGAVLLLALLLVLGSLAIAVKAAAAGIKLAIVFGAFLWMIVRAMWVKLDPPEGREVTRKEAPQLFALLDQLQRELEVRARFHHVLITDDLNAAVVQTPRLGILGWHVNHLIIGLPLMKALTRKQLAAVLAHEMGHLAGGHARLGNWVYRLRLGSAGRGSRTCCANRSRPAASCSARSSTASCRTSPRCRFRSRAPTSTRPMPPPRGSPRRPPPPRR